MQEYVAREVSNKKKKTFHEKQVEIAHKIPMATRKYTKKAKAIEKKNRVKEFFKRLLKLN